MTRNRYLRAAVPVCTLLVLSSLTFQRCNGGASRPKGVHHVILIVVDTLRADALSCYGGEGAQTPHIDELASDSIVFTQARAASSWTLPSMASIMTGMPVAVHRVFKGSSVLPRNLPTIASHMRDAGYRTASAGMNGYLKARTRINRGFQEHHFPVHFWFEGFGFERPDLSWLKRFENKRRYNSTPYVTGFARRWLDRHHDEDFFLWLHYYDPHGPYYPPPRLMPEGPRPRGAPRIVHKRKDARRARNPAQRQWVEDLYLGEVRWIDEHIGRILDHLEEHDIYDDALIVFTSDHGEEFWEHGGYEHGHSLVDEVIHVPLMVKLPARMQRSAAAGGCTGSGKRGDVDDRVDEFVTNMGIMPMILDVCGVDDYDPHLASHSLSPYVGLGEIEQPRPPIFAGGMLYGKDKEMVLADGMKYIFRTSSGKASIVNLLEDPEEKEKLSDPDGELAARGEELLDAHHALAGKLRREYDIGAEGEEEKLDKETIEELEALGYVL
jgi:arylsulfatase A-like enzyme